LHDAPTSNPRFFLIIRLLEIFQLPLVIRFVAFKDVDIAVIRADFEIQIIRPIPAVYEVRDIKILLSHGEANRPLSGGMPGITLHVKFYIF
jgi:hypothetical protein